jgi:hypothetical protein
LVVVNGSRHGTPFDASEATNCSLLALLTDKPLLPHGRLACDTAARAQARFLSIRGRVLELLENAADTYGRESRKTVSCRLRRLRRGDTLAHHSR